MDNQDQAHGDKLAQVADLEALAADALKAVDESGLADLAKKIPGELMDRVRAIFKFQAPHPAIQEAKDTILGIARHPDLKPEHIEAALQPAEKAVQDATNITPGTEYVAELGGYYKKTPSGAYIRELTGHRKTAMWYYLKPRWILRRKMQAAIRHKVRSLIHPVNAIKSSSAEVPVADPYMDAGGCELCGGKAPDGHRTTCPLKIDPSLK
jgi:hypothetical protein